MSPGEEALWEQHFEKHPPMGRLLQNLLQLTAMLGVVLDKHVHGKDFDPDKWFFWQPPDETPKAQPTANDARGESEEDLNLGRHALLDSMGVDHAGRQHQDSQC